MRITGETTVDSLYHSEDELTHYGVKGQKWGVRRYQNKDGSLTPAGKKRIQDAGVMYFPKYDRKRRKYSDPVKNRLAVTRKSDQDQDLNDTFDREKTRLLKERTSLQKAGYKFVKNPDPDVEEHNNDILAYLVPKTPAMKAARRKSMEKQIDEYADATLADLGLRNTEQAKQFVKEHLMDSNLVRYEMGLPRKD